MILSVLTLQPADGRIEDLITFYQEGGVLEASGALSTQVMVAEDNPTTLVVTALWPDDEAYTVWQNSPVRLEFGRSMASFFDSGDSARSHRFHVVHHTDRES